VHETKLILFSTDHCMLCDAALELLFSMPELQGLSLAVVDVAEDDELVHRYGERLPVLRSGERELDWPFSRDEVSQIIG
jgi:hypothetical protein